MSTTVNMRRKGHSLQACREWDGEELEALPEHTDLKVKITRARSVNQNSMYWGLLRRVVRNGPEWMSNQWPTADHLSDALQLELGFVRQIKLPDGTVYGVPESKTFENMSQTKFNTYMEAVLVKLGEWLETDPLAFLEDAA